MHRIKPVSLFLGGFLVFLTLGTAFAAGDVVATQIPPAAPASGLPWWAWPLILFVVIFALGIVAVLGGSIRR